MFHTRPDKRENYENVEDKYTFLIWEIQQFFGGGMNIMVKIVRNEDDDK